MGYILNRIGGNISVMADWTPCDDPRDCHYQWKRNDKSYCNILGCDENGNAPYKPMQCPFYKKKRKEKP